MDISTFVSVSFALVALGHEPQSTAIVGAEHFGLATVQLSQFIGWVYPAIAYLIIAVVIRVRGLGRITALLGFLVFLTNIVGGISFLHPVNSVQKYQDPGLFLLGLYSLALGILLFKFENQTSRTPART